MKTRAAACIVFLAVAAVAAPPQVEEVRTYTLAECIEIGLRNSGNLVSARFDEAIAAAVVSQVRAQYLPHFYVSGSYARTDEAQDMAIGPFEIPLGSRDRASVQAEIVQPIMPAAPARAALQGAKRSREAAYWGVVDGRRRIIRDVRAGFYDILLVREQLHVVQQSVIQLGLALQQTEKRYDRGTAPKFEVLQAKVRYDNEVREMMTNRNALDTAMVSFKRLLNLDKADFDIEGQLLFEPVDTSLADLLEKAGGDRPAVRALEENVHAMRHDLEAARGARLPSVNSSFAWGWGNTSSFVPVGDAFDWYWNAGISLRWDFWDGGLTSGRVRQKTLEWERARVELAEAQKSNSLEVQLAYIRMRNAREWIESRADDVDLAEEALDIAETRYEVGAGTFLDFSEANVAVTSARLGYIQAVHEHATAVAELRYASGREDF